MRKTLVQKTFGAYRAPSGSPFPDLVGHQRSSFDWLLKDGLKELFKEFSPITDYSGKSLNSSLKALTLANRSMTKSSRAKICAPTKRQ